MQVTVTTSLHDSHDSYQIELTARSSTYNLYKPTNTTAIAAAVAVLVQELTKAVEDNCKRRSPLSPFQADPLP